MVWIGAAAALIGGLLALIGFIWLLVLSFDRGGIIWALLVFFFNIAAGLVFCFVYKTGWVPWLLMVLGSIVAGGGVALGYSDTFLQAIRP